MKIQSKINPKTKKSDQNKSKKLVNTIENINSITEVKKAKVNFIKGKKEKIKEIVKTKDKIKKTKSKKKIRTLWVRRKKKA